MFLGNGSVQNKVVYDAVAILINLRSVDTFLNSASGKARGIVKKTVGSADLKQTQFKNAEV